MFGKFLMQKNLDNEVWCRLYKEGNGQILRKLNVCLETQNQRNNIKIITMS